MNYTEQIVSILSESDMRIDTYIAEELKLFSRSQAKIRIEKVLVNGKETKVSRKIHAGDRLEVFYTDPPSLDLVPEKIPLSILFENDDVIVLNKPQGMVVHPGCGNPSGTLVNALIYYCEQIKINFNNTGIRPGIVHRLDKDTSGVLITAKNPESHHFLATQFARSRVRKNYLAIVKGQPPEQSGIIDTYITRDVHNRKRFRASEAGGKRGITLYQIKRTRGTYSLLLLKPRTGRTHQLRVHCKHIHCPVAGDPLYSRNERRFPDITLMLHAMTLKIRLPGQKDLSVFKAPLPGHFKQFMKKTGLSG
jgi:23S rRNA pseudouridine1911/1915/1917 synthase